MSIVIPSLRAAIAVPPWVKNELWRRAQAVPSLDLRFADNKSLVDAVTGASLITFSRAYSGTYVDSAGVLQTAATNEPRFDHNPITGESLGLLVEEQRTQILELTDALATQTKTVTATAHALSFYGSGTVVLSGVHSATVVGTGAYPARTTLTFTPTAGSLTLTVTGTVQFGQLEAGAFATSYIPNPTTNAVTRSAEAVTITGTAFSGWYRQDEGTVFSAFSIPTSSTTGGARVYSISNSDATVQAWLRLQGGTNRIYEVTDSSIQQASLSAGTFSAGVLYAGAVALKTNDFGFSENGSTPTVDNSGTLGTVDGMGIGMSSSGAAPLNGHIRRFTYWSQALPSRLQALTQ
jgi:hypothetical protein